ncbi:MAG: STAS domain-containing protein [Candidatus Rokubacteria bacterium]|nr:STAS domain-containing protein [Candidatus Rokubacteria bacterium]
MSPIRVVVPDKELDLASAVRMSRVLQEHLDAGEIRLVLDLGGLTYVDSSGLGEMLRALKRAREGGGDLRLCGLFGYALRIFEMTGLDKVLAVYATRQEALTSWGTGSDGRPTRRSGLAATS